MFTDLLLLRCQMGADPEEIGAGVPVGPGRQLSDGMTGRGTRISTTISKEQNLGLRVPIA